MSAHKIVVLMGGVSSERSVSVASGSNVCAVLEKSHSVTPIEIKENGEWVVGVPPAQPILDVRYLAEEVGACIPNQEEMRPVVNPWDLPQYGDVVFIAMHGPGGEDGTIQGLLETLGMPYTGSGVLASAMAMDKALTKQVVHTNGIQTPIWVSITRWAWEHHKEQLLQQIEQHLPGGCFVKANDLGSSIGTYLVDNRDDLTTAICKALSFSCKCLVEARVKGREFTCPVVGSSQIGKMEPLAVTEIVPRHSFFDYEAKYDPNLTEEITPAKISDALTGRIQDLSVQVHDLLGCAGVSRSDFIANDEGVHFLEINTIPGLTSSSIIPRACQAMNRSFSSLLNGLVEHALECAR